MTALSTSSAMRYDANQIELAKSIFKSVGRVAVVDDDMMNVCTSLAASGPAFALTFIESLADGGVKMGLSRSESRIMAAQAVKGAADLILQTNLHPAELRDMIWYVSPIVLTIL